MARASMCKMLARTGLLASLTALLLAGCSGSTTTVIEKPTPTVTVTRTLPPKVVTHWRTRIVTVTAPAAPTGVSCYIVAGLPYPPGYARGQAGTPATCTAALNLINGTPALTLTAPSGAAATYQVGPMP
jgi:hypothetical protein